MDPISASNHICHVNLATGFSGGERQTLELIKQQIQEGKNLVVVANPKSPLVKEVRNLACKLILCKHFTQQHSSSLSKEYPIIHVHEGRAIYWALLQNLLYKTPYIITRRIDNKLKSKWLSSFSYNRASALVGLSQEIIRRLTERHPDKRIYKVPSSPVTYPSDPIRVKSIKENFSNKFIVIHAANMLKHKGFDVTIEAARHLKENKEIQIVLLGDGPEKKNLEDLASGLNNVTFMGKCNDMGNWFKAADLIVHPSYTEGLGSVLLEAINAGLPAIATNTGGIPDIIKDEKSGILISVGDHHGLALAILRVKNDVQFRNSLISVGKKNMQEFRIDVTSKKYNSIYREILDERN